MGEIVQQMFAELREGVLNRERHKLEALRRMDDQVDVLETDLVDLGYWTLDEDIQTSAAVRYLLRELSDKLSSALDATIRAVRETDQCVVEEVLTMRADIDYLSKQTLELQSKALADVGPEQIEVLRMEMTTLENLKRIHTHLKRVAREIVP